MTFDADRIGTVETHEFQRALTNFGYNLQPQTISILVRRYSNDGRIGFDDFVSCCVKLRALTSNNDLFICIVKCFLTLLGHFQARDTMRNGTATFRFDDVSVIIIRG